MIAASDLVPANAGPHSVTRYGPVAARLVLGLVFTLAGASIFVLMSRLPPVQPGLAGTFTTVFFQSHWVVFVDVTELVAGVLLLVNRFVPFALVTLAAILSNILVFHLAMQPQTIVLPLFLTALWFVLAYQHRANLTALFQ